MYIEKIQKQTVVEQVMLKIRELVVNKHLKVGDKIPTEVELAKLFGIGRSSIREAIKIFNYLGILVTNTSKGTYVCDGTSISSEALTWAVFLGTKELSDLIRVRGALELWSIIDLTSKYKEDPESVQEIIKQLESEISIMIQNVKKGDKLKLIEADYNFHYHIIYSSKNNLFLLIYEILKSFLYEEMKQAHIGTLYYENVFMTHQVLCEAIKTGSISEAAMALKTHLERTEDYIKRALKQS